MAWSDAAREAAAAARRLHTQTTAAKTQRAVANYKPATMIKQNMARSSELLVAQQLRGQHIGKGLPIDVLVKSGTRTMGFEVKTLVDNKNDKITMHGDSYARKVAWARSNHASLHTIVIDKRFAGTSQYYHKGIGSFRLTGLIAVKNGMALRKMVGI